MLPTSVGPVASPAFDHNNPPVEVSRAKMPLDPVTTRRGPAIAMPRTDGSTVDVHFGEPVALSNAPMPELGPISGAYTTPSATTGALAGTVQRLRRSATLPTPIVVSPA